MMSKWLKVFLLILISSCISPNYTTAQTILTKKRIKVNLRQIGHDLLLKSGDSTSIVLPIENELNSYKVQFDTDFAFNPTELSTIIHDNLEKNNETDEYIVEIEDCESEAIIYSYEVSLITTVTEIACGKRIQPKGCYIIHINFLNQEEPSNYLGTFVISLIVLALLLLIYFLKPNKKSSKSTIDPNIKSIGDFIFDNTKMTLIYKGDIIELSSKETDLLFLLFSHKNKVVERETILQIVWGDEGDYIGRTLDVFVSKLRKKLAADSDIKIVNIRGIGYKLIE
jgi:hypothetical protein